MFPNVDDEKNHSHRWSYGSDDDDDDRPLSTFMSSHNNVDQLPLETSKHHPSSTRISKQQQNSNSSPLAIKADEKQLTGPLGSNL